MRGKRYLVLKINKRKNVNIQIGVQDKNGNAVTTQPKKVNVVQVTKETSQFSNKGSISYMNYENYPAV